MAGLPGTGLGGIFYVLLVLWMVLRESWLLARRSSSRGRWTSVGRFASLSAMIVTVLWIEGLGLQNIIITTMPVAAEPRAMLQHDAAFALDALTPELAFAPFAILVVLMLLVRVAGLLLRQPREAPVRD